ncbi:MAG: glycosyltransferase family 4 protein [Anaerolineae bacterium]|nr:glycosyltransferase family 4 protein [Anaerolineae bacterium]
MPEALPHLEGIVASCSIGRDRLQQGGVPSEKIVTIPLGIDLETFQLAGAEQRAAARATLGLPPAALVVGSFQKDGQGWDEGDQPKLIKGPDVLLAVLEALHQRMPSLHVLLTGKARGFVKQGLRARGIPYTHRVLEDYRQIVACYHALDLYVIPARDEGGPASLLESWATGVPVVSTQVGMPADLIRHGENGWLAPVGEGDALVEAGLAVLQNATLRTTVTRQAYMDAQSYSWPQIAARYAAEIYQPYLASVR